LAEAFLRIANYLESERHTREQIKAALRYPIIVIIGISIAIIITSVVVVPNFAAIFIQAKVDLPLQTRIILAISDFMVAYWLILLISGLIIGVAIKLWLHTQLGRYQWDKFKLHLPIIGSIIRRALLGRYARVFSVTLASGVPLIQALTDVAQAVDNAYMSTLILQMRNGIERGETLTHTAQASGLFTPLILQMIEVGEETGNIDNLLLQVAEVYEREVDYATKNLTVVMEPILLVIIGMMILILAFGIFLPMWNLISVYQ
jgi:MSHA biogenesis protein MshG